MKFSLGNVYVTRNALEYARSRAFNLQVLIFRHSTGDWGDLDASDKRMNDAAVASGADRIFSMYEVEGEKWYVITEHDRSVTTVMLASDY